MNKIALPLIALAVAIIICGLTVNGFRPTVDTAVNRSYDTIDKVVDDHLAPDPLADTMMVHDTITNRNNTAVWVVGFFILAVVLGAVGWYFHLHLSTEHKRESSKLLRAEKKKDRPQQLPTSNGVPWVTGVSRPQLPPPPDGVRYLPLPDDNGDDNSASWTI